MKLIPYTAPIIEEPVKPRQPVAWLMEWSDDRYKGKLFAQVYLYCPSPAHSQDDAIKWAKVTPLYKL